MFCWTNEVMPVSSVAHQHNQRCHYWLLPFACKQACCPSYYMHIVTFCMGLSALLTCLSTAAVACLSSILSMLQKNSGALHSQAESAANCSEHASLHARNSTDLSCRAISNSGFVAPSSAFPSRRANPADTSGR